MATFEKMKEYVESHRPLMQYDFASEALANLSAFTNVVEATLSIEPKAISRKFTRFTFHQLASGKANEIIGRKAIRAIGKLFPLNDEWMEELWTDGEFQICIEPMGIPDTFDEWSEIYNDLLTSDKKNPTDDWWSPIVFTSMFTHWGLNDEIWTAATKRYGWPFKRVPKIFLEIHSDAREIDFKKLDDLLQKNGLGYMKTVSDFVCQATGSHFIDFNYEYQYDVSFTRKNIKILQRDYKRAKRVMAIVDKAERMVAKNKDILKLYVKLVKKASSPRSRRGW